MNTPASPLPWKVVYDDHQEVEGFNWEKHSSPRVVDTSGVTVFSPHQYVNHPGTYDKQADELTQLIASRINSYPRLVAALKALIGEGVEENLRGALALLRELGEV